MLLAMTKAQKLEVAVLNSRSLKDHLPRPKPNLPDVSGGQGLHVLNKIVGSPRN